MESRTKLDEKAVPNLCGIKNRTKFYNKILYIKHYPARLKALQSWTKKLYKVGRKSRTKIMIQVKNRTKFCDKTIST